MILTKNKILDEKNKKRIKITPFDKTSIGPASIDLRLGDEVRIFKNKNNKIKAIDSFDYKKITKKISINKGHTLKPGDLVLGITKENCVGVGDSITDIPLFEQCEYSISVKNSLDIVKKKTDYVTKSERGYGAKEAIEYILKELY